MIGAVVQTVPLGRVKGAADVDGLDVGRGHAGVQGVQGGILVFGRGPEGQVVAIDVDRRGRDERELLKVGMPGGKCLQTGQRLSQVGGFGRLELLHEPVTLAQVDAIGLPLAHRQVGRGLDLDPEIPQHELVVDIGLVLAHEPPVRHPAHGKVGTLGQHPVFLFRKAAVRRQDVGQGQPGQAKKEHGGHGAAKEVDAPVGAILFAFEGSDLLAGLHGRLL